MPSGILDHASGVVEGVIATAVCGMLVTFAHWAHRLVSGWFRVPALIRAYLAVVLFLAAMWFFPAQDNFQVRLATYFIIGISINGFIRATFKGYADLGIVAAFRTTQQGVDFKRSLQLATSSLDFLGIGASKLTENQAEFEAAMRRCAVGGKTVRLLLSRPDNPLLETLAKRNDIAADRYSRNVTDSLRRIARLAADHNLNIQVRFYPHQKDKDFQNFRLMFIDNRTCLWSWTVWDTTLGRNNPQVVLLNSAVGGLPQSAYHAFHDYFNRLWEDESVEVADLQQF